MVNQSVTVERFFDMPDRIAALPRDARGFPVPTFVEWLDKAGRRVAPGQGVPDFRLVSRHHLLSCIKRDLCWICGQPLGSRKAFVIGPMCSINRVSSEPPNHRDCAVFAATNCPFLSRPLAKRRTAGLPEEFVKPAGFMIERNPEVAAVWITKTYRVFEASRGEAGTLFEIGDPETVLWFSEGRGATRAECLRSFETGLPILLDMARKDGQQAVAELVQKTGQARRLLPAV